MTSIRKYKKLWKSSRKREWRDVGFCKRLKTLRKLTRSRVYTFRVLDSEGTGDTLILPNKSRRKRGKHEKKIL